MPIPTKCYTLDNSEARSIQPLQMSSTASRRKGPYRKTPVSPKSHLFQVTCRLNFNNLH